MKVMIVIDLDTMVKISAIVTAIGESPQAQPIIEAMHGMKEAMADFRHATLEASIPLNTGESEQLWKEALEEFRRSEQRGTVDNWIPSGVKGH